MAFTMNNSLKEGAVTAAQVQQHATRVPWWVDVAGAAAAAVAALLTWVAVTSVGGVDLAAVEGGAVQHVGAVEVGLAAFVAGLVGLLALRLLGRWTPRSLTVWTWLAVAVLVVSMLGPASATSPAAAAGLVCLHIVVAAVVIATARWSRRRTPALGGTPRRS